MALPLSAVLSEKAVGILLALVRAGLDMDPLWLRSGVAAGADVLRLLLCRITSGSSPATPVDVALGAHLCDKASAGSSGRTVRDTGGSSASTWCMLSMAEKPRTAFILSAGGAAAAAAAAPEGTRAAAAEQMVQQEGLLSDLLRLASLSDSRAQLAGVSCLAMLACSPVSAAVMVEHDSTGSVLGLCLNVGTHEVQATCFRAICAIAYHSLQNKQALAADSELMQALDKAGCGGHSKTWELYAEVKSALTTSQNMTSNVL